MRGILTLVGMTALLALAACSKSPEQGAGNAGSGKAGNDATPGGGTEGGAVVGIKLTPGQWETTTEVVDLKVEGLPPGVPAEAMAQVRPPKTTVKSCLTPEDAANPNARMLAAQKDSRCTTSRMGMSGGRIDIAMACPVQEGSGDMTMTMTGQYDAASYEMNGDMVMNGPNGMHMTMKSRTTGRRIGDCPA